MSASPERGLISRSRDFRRDMLTPSGGWLHDIVVGASSVTGLSDYFLLGVIFVGSWCILRLAEREIALILGLGFDLTIPLQHSLTANARVKERHQHHMEQYWPVFFTGMAIEFACLLFVHPTMFTLVVCLKTTVCTAMWFVQGPSAAATAPAPTTTRPKTTQPATDVPSTDAPAGGAEAPSGTGERSAKEKKISDMANELRAKGYKSTTSCKVIADGILSQKGATPEKVKASLDKRLNASPQEKEEYEKQAKEYKEKKDKERKERKEAKNSHQTPQT